MTHAEEKAIRAKRRAIKRQERERRRAEREVRRARRERIHAGGPVVFEPREPTYAELHSATFTHFCPDCGRWFKSESVFEEPCEFHKPISKKMLCRMAGVVQRQSQVGPDKKRALSCSDEGSNHSPGHQSDSRQGTLF